MKKEKTYTLTITQEQATVIATACEFLARIQSGQIKEAFDHLPLDENIDWGVYHEIQDNLTKRLPEILKGGIDGWHSSFGVGNPELPKSHDIAWDLYQVLRHKLAWERAVKEGLIESEDSPRKFPEMMFVSYDTPMQFGTEPLAKIEVNK
jgi:hypothetical protein